MSSTITTKDLTKPDKTDLENNIVNVSVNGIILFFLIILAIGWFSFFIYSRKNEAGQVRRLFYPEVPIIPRV